jgi:hypothetical protein
MGSLYFSLLPGRERGFARDLFLHQGVHENERRGAADKRWAAYGPQEVIGADVVCFRCSGLYLFVDKSDTPCLGEFSLISPGTRNPVT